MPIIHGPEFFSWCAARSDLQMLDPLPLPEEQRSTTCKLVALRVAMEQLATREGLPPPPPVHRRDAETKADMLRAGEVSLRHRAKQAYGSVVGEAYRAGDVVGLARDCGFDATWSEAPSRDAYLGRLCELIDLGHAPVIFFAVDCDTGDPVAANDYNEHGAVVAGYYHEDERLRFILVQWGNFYHVDGETLLHSTDTLPERHRSETFHKFGGPGGELPVRWWEDEFVQRRLHWNTAGSERRSQPAAESLARTVVCPDLSRRRHGEGRVDYWLYKLDAAA